VRCWHIPFSAELARVPNSVILADVGEGAHEGVRQLFAQADHLGAPDLVPVLEAGGAEVLVDWKEFAAERTVVGQMDRTQDKAERHLLCLSVDYLASAMCLHEMCRAVAIDPGFHGGSVVPLRLDATPIPPEIATPNPIWLDFRDCDQAEPWRLLLEACHTDLGCTATAWLEARDGVGRELARHKSVNLVVPTAGVRWDNLIADLSSRNYADLAVVDLHDGRTEYRDGLLSRILAELGASVNRLPKRPNDLRDFTDRMLALRRKARVCVQHFDEVQNRRPSYDISLFKALRWLVIHQEQPLTLLIQSRVPVSVLQPDGPQDSDLASQLTTVELR
jgi:TIR domain